MPSNPFHTILTIARFERKTLLRSWFFRIFAGLFITGLGIFNIAVFVEGSDSPWLFRALPASLPYANLIILNLGQAIVAVFLASEFLKHDRKNDSTEVIYARSMTNFEYITGKTLGIISVFIILNFVILLMGIGFSFLSGDSAKGILEFFLYPLIISVPTLIYILGLAFFLMTLIRNQAITFIILLGYIGLTVFYLDEKYYHLFDYIAYKIPMLSSSITGMAYLNELILHRGVYFLMGIGLIFFTIYRIQRLPQISRFKQIPLLFAFLFVVSALFLGYTYIDLKKAVISEKNQIMALNNQYAGYPKITIESCNIELEHHGNTINTKAFLNIKNYQNQTIDSLVFSLNPGLEILKIEVDGAETTFSRSLHIIRIRHTIPSGHASNVIFYYQGFINENTHFADLNSSEYKDYMTLDLYKARKRFAFLQNNYVCLTHESLWYPVSGVIYAPARPLNYEPDFTLFRLKVKTFSHLVAISQGEVKNPENGAYEFVNEMPLPKISLLIGDYNKMSVSVDSVDYALYTIKGNEYYLREFTDIKDTLPSLIRELKNEYENLLELNYGFKRFTLAEVPLNFALDKHLYTIVSDAVQPEIVFYPEKGLIMRDTDFKKRKKRFEKNMQADNEQVTPEELQSRMFKQFVRNNYLGRFDDNYQFRNIIDRYTYSLIPHFYSHLTRLKSEEWPILNLAMEVYLLERNNPAATGGYRPFWTIPRNEKINIELQKSDLQRLISSGVNNIEDKENRYDPITVSNIAIAKCHYLFSMFKARFGEKELSKTINQLISKNIHQTFHLSDFEKAIEQEFNHSITNDIEQWYSGKELPGYHMKDLQTYKVIDGEHTRYQVRVSISNPEPADGFVLVTLSLDEAGNQRSFNDNQQQPDFSTRILIPAQSAREFGAVFQSEPKRMNIYTDISANLPTEFAYEISGMFNETKKNSGFDGTRPIEPFTNTSEPNEFIVDNEDEGFSYSEEINESYLRSLINKGGKSRYGYTGINFWNPPNQWTSVLGIGFYGKYIRSAMYTATGDGTRKATWNATLPEAAYYDVYCYIEKAAANWQGFRNQEKTVYNFNVYHDDGVEEFTIPDDEADKGWNYLGTFFVSPENAKIELNNKSTGKVIFADAVKWVKK